MEWVISIVPRGQIFTECSQRISIIFLPYAFYTSFTIPFTICFARRVFTMVFTIFLAERFYNIFTLLSFYKYLFHYNSVLLHYVSPFSFYSFYNGSYKESSEKKRHIYMHIHRGRLG